MTFSLRSRWIHGLVCVVLFLLHSVHLFGLCLPVMDFSMQKWEGRFIAESCQYWWSIFGALLRYLTQIPSTQANGAHELTNSSVTCWPTSFSIWTPSRRENDLFFFSSSSTLYVAAVWMTGFEHSAVRLCHDALSEKCRAECILAKRCRLQTNYPTQLLQTTLRRESW